MYSIPHKQFAISQGVPLKKFPQINGLQRGWKRYHPVLDKKGGGGVSFLGLGYGFSSMENTPLVFSKQKGWGGIYMTELEFLFQFFVLMAVLGFVIFCLGVGDD